MSPNKIPEVNVNFDQCYDLLTHGILKETFRKARPIYGFFTRKNIFFQGVSRFFFISNLYGPHSLKKTGI